MGIWSEAGGVGGLVLISGEWRVESFVCGLKPLITLVTRLITLNDFIDF